MKHTRIHGLPDWFGLVLFGVPTLVAAALAAVGSTSGFRKWWGVVLILPSLLMGALAIITLMSEITLERELPAIFLLALALPVGVSGVILLRWRPRSRNYGA